VVRLVPHFDAPDHFAVMDAIVRVGKELSGIWKILVVFNALPSVARDYPWRTRISTYRRPAVN
jgi:predicted DCC family thiol-disulfide oxidoreductase YuxK